MSKRYLWALGLVCMLTALIAFTAWAVPLQITYQGQLTDTTGNPVPDGDYEMSFALYNVSTGGTALWSEAQTIAVANGIYTVILGQSENELDPTHFVGDLYLGVTVGTDSEMTPRQSITSVGYALRAYIADTVKAGAVTTIMLQDAAVDTAKVADNAITESKLEDATVTAVKLQDGATLSEISDDDGEGSGLDADFLDGLDSTDFMLVDTDNWVDEAGDTMTGTLNLAVDGLVAGTDQLVISGGNVGIGTASPGERLDVDGDINTSGTYKIDGTTAVRVESYNTFLGRSAGYANTTGEYNTFVGYNAGLSNKTGGNNTFLGNYAGQANATGNENLFVGNYAGMQNTGGVNNTFLGLNAGRLNTTGQYNTFVGHGAGYANTTANDNAFVGYHAGYSNTGGLNNTFLGNWAGFSNTTGNGNVFLGYRSGYKEAGSNKLYIANSDTSTPLIYGQFDSGVVTINGTAQITGNLTVTGTVAGSGINADTLDGLDATDFAPAAHNHDTRYYTEAEVDTMVAALETRIAQLEALLANVTRAGDDITFSGVNVYVVNGTGTTYGTVNGLGNLIVGYNELRGTDDDRTGSHNIVVGREHNYSSYGGLVAGYHNTISGYYASVSGGYGNTASSNYASSVSGGYGNTASGNYAKVSGGLSNTAIGSYSSVSGGRNNIASGVYSFVGGGGGAAATDGNEAFGHYSAILGGMQNIAGDPALSDHSLGQQSTVSGGASNTASGDYTSAVGDSGRVYVDGTVVH
jgi:hypothetical protein